MVVDKFSPDAFHRYLLSRIDLAGSLKQAAKDWGISSLYLNEIIHGYRDPAPTLLKALGFHRHVEYWRLPTAIAEEPQP